MADRQPGPAVPNVAERMMEDNDDDVPDGAELTFDNVERNGTEPRDCQHDGYAELHENSKDLERCINSFHLAKVNGEESNMVLRQQDGNGETYQEDSETLRRDRKDQHGKAPARVTIIFAHQVTTTTTSVSDGDDGAQQQQRVVIKRYRRRGVAVGYIWRALKEIALMQKHGDNVHILEPITVLRDKNFIYMVLPRASSWDSLDRTVVAFRRYRIMPHATQAKEYGDWALAVFRKILKILLFFCRHNICHHDLSAGNFLFLREDPDSLVAFDLEMAHKIPVLEPITARRRKLITDRGYFGTTRFLAPEAFLGLRREDELQYDGVAIDLWSAAMCLAFMLMRGHYICDERPHKYDSGFDWLIMDRERKRQQGLLDLANIGNLRNNVAAYVRMADTYPQATNLLEQILVTDKRTRITLAQAWHQNM